MQTAYPLCLFRQLVSACANPQAHDGGYKGRPTLVNHPGPQFVSIAGGAPDRLVVLKHHVSQFNVSRSAYLMPDGSVAIPG